MKAIFSFLLLGLLLINFRPTALEAQTLSTEVHEDWAVTLPNGQNCLDIQVMNGYSYDLIYLGYWNYADHYQVSKRDSAGTVVASVNQENVTNIFCYNGKILLCKYDDVSEIFETYHAKLYNDNFNLLEDTIWSPPWPLANIRLQFYYDEMYLWKISSGTANNARTSKLEKLDPNSLQGLDSLHLDSVNCGDILIYENNIQYFAKYGGSYYLNVFKDEGPEITKRLKLSANPQVISSDLPISGCHFYNFFGHDSSLYYLYGVANGLKIVKKDTGAFSTSWQVPVSVSIGPGKPAICSQENRLLLAGGDGSILKINPASGAVMGLKIVTSITSSFINHYFGKIGAYPFMAVGPTSLNINEPLRFYILDPVTLDTLTTKVISGISGDHDYWVKYSGDKIFVYGNKIVEISVLTSGSVFPSFKLLTGTPVTDATNGQTTIMVSTPTPPEISFNLNHDTFWVKNVGATTKSVLCKKIILEEVSGTSNYFSWGGLYGPGVPVSSIPIAIAAGDSFSGFSSYYEANNLIGFTKIRYVFFNQDDINDSVYFDITYDITVGVGTIDPALSLKVYPNPASDYLLIEGVNKTRLEIYNQLGSLVLSTCSLRCDLSFLPPGIYSYRLYDGEKYVQSAKLIKR